ncbi:uncharacterized protein LOC121235607 [Juglans microcarpa x Juglans regia]|uniref:uncharacterized protein LOC121235607 n=1 Tax=Juglans microcarpa x Juglans regia TaxID=2249226 RepID=UPI001B7F46E4|nr:uncharacterized protein LOC121235607 [Juglans microcarpa x Juglans regia]
MLLDLYTDDPSHEHQVSADFRRSIFWVCPHQGICKINWDVAVDSKLCKLGIGVAVRDETGNFLATLRKKLDLMPDPKLAEAKAVGIAVQFGLELGMKRVILEGDFKVVVKELELQNQTGSYFGMIILDTQVSIAKLETCIINHVNREGNSIAHNLAKAALHVSDYLVDMEETPLFYQML